MAREISAAISPGSGGMPVIETVLLADPVGDELVIEMGAVGICHTDIGVGGFITEPRILGHEGAGTVVAIGDAVTRFAPGDRVVATFGSCGTCPNCADDRPAYCYDHAAINVMGTARQAGPAVRRPDGTPVDARFFQQSAFATHALVTDRNVVKIPDALDFVTAAPLGCGVQTGVGAVINSLAAKPGKGLLVIGCGAVGLSAVMAGRIAGCAPIVAIDIIDERLAHARRMGATHVLRGDAENLADAVRAIAGGGVSYALDTAGLQTTFELGLAALHPGGNLGVVTAPGGFGEPVPHPGGLTFMATTMTGVIEGDSVPDRFIPWMIERYFAGELPYDELIVTYPFAAIADALADAANGKAIKPVLTF